MVGTVFHDRKQRKQGGPKSKIFFMFFVGVFLEEESIEVSFILL